MAQIEGNDLLKLRDRPQRTKVHMGIFQPQTVVSARINDASVEKGERVLTVSVLSGSLANIDNGMTIYVGGAAGGREIARIRAISGGGGTITIAENSIDWQNEWYLTVTDFYEPWAVFPRITLSANNVPTFYRDYDQLYNNEHTAWQPVVVMGGNAAAILEDGSTDIYYSASGSYTLNGTLSSYLWEFDGGTPTGSVALNPGNVSYDTPGYYTTKLTITGSNGKTYTGVRHIMIFDRENQGGASPIEAWGMKSFNGSRTQNGYQASFWARQLVDDTVLVDHALVVLFSEDWEGEQPGKIGGNTLGRSNILFAGYVKEGSIEKDAYDNVYNFDVVSVTNVMRSLSTYSATFESKQNTSSWLEVTDMTVDKAAIAYLQDMSTVLKIADFHMTGDTKSFQYADMARGNLFGSLEEFYGGTIFAEMVSDRQGGIYAEINASLQPTGSRTLPTLIDFNNQDWRGKFIIPELITPILAYVELGGIAYSGPSTGTFEPLMTSAPGDPAGYYGRVERSQGLVLAGQDQLNVLSGLVWNKVNSRFRNLQMPMAGDYRAIDIAPQKRVTLTVAAEDTHRGIVWNQKKFLLNEISYQYDPINELLLMNNVIDEETEGGSRGGISVGATIPIPVAPPYQTPQGTLPQFPPFPEIPPIIPPPQSEEWVIMSATWFTTGSSPNISKFGILRTRDWSSTGTPTWDLVPGLSVTGGYPGKAFVIDPRMPNRAYTIDYRDIYKTENLLASDPADINWESILTYDELEANLLPNENILNTLISISVSPTDSSVIVKYNSSANAFASGTWYYAQSDDQDNFLFGRFPAPIGIGPVALGLIAREGRVSYSNNGSRVYATLQQRGESGHGIGYNGYVAISDDNGKTWPQENLITLDQNVWKDGIRGMFIDPRDPSGETVLAAENYASEDSKIIFSSDSLISRADVSMFWGGVLYATWWNNFLLAFDSRFARGFLPGPTYCPENGGIYIGLMDQEENPEVVYAMTKDFFTWEFRSFFLGGDGFTSAHGFKVNPTNHLRHYCVAPRDTPPTGTSLPLIVPFGSTDGGFTWENKDGNISDLLGNFQWFLQSEIFVVTS